MRAHLAWTIALVSCASTAEKAPAPPAPAAAPTAPAPVAAAAARSDACPAECADGAPPRAAQPNAQCAEYEKIGDLMAAGVRERLLAGYAKCGDGHNILGELGATYALENRFDCAVACVRNELLHPGASHESIRMAAALLERLPQKDQPRLTALGSDADHPIYVPDIRHEYLWVDAVACGPGDRGQVGAQSLIERDGRELDQLHYKCKGGEERSTYFDYSADPQEQALKKMLQERISPTKPKAK